MRPGAASFLAAALALAFFGAGAQASQSRTNVNTAPVEAASVENAPDPAQLRPARVRQLFPYWTDYLSLNPADRDLFAVRYQMTGLREDGGTPGLWRREGETFQRLISEPDGSITPPDPALFEADGEVYTDAAPGEASITLIARPRIEPARSLPAPALTGAIAQANAAIRRRAGVLSLFTPSFKSVVLVFDGPAPDGYAILPDGRREALIAEQNTLRFHPRRRALRNAERLELGETPVSLALSTQ